MNDSVVEKNWNVCIIVTEKYAGVVDGIGGVSRTQLNICDGGFLRKWLTTKFVDVSCRCLTGF